MGSLNNSAERLGFIGLGAMGFGMACNLLSKPNYTVTGFDVYPPSAQKFVDRGGKVESSPRDVAAKSDFFICMAANADQTTEILFNENTGAAKGTE